MDQNNNPNILLIMADQMRWDALGCNGNEIIETPNFNRLAESGVNFANAYSPNPICVPARASLTTGSYPHKCTGRKENKGSIKEGFPLLGEELNRRGYETYAMGKLHYLPYMPPGEERTTYGIKNVELCESGRILRKYDPRGELTGLEDYHDYLYTVGWGGYTRGHGLGNNDIFAAASPIPQEHYVDAWVVDRSVAHIREHVRNSPGQPFFMWTSFPKPHSAFDPPRPYDQMYDPRRMPEPVGDIEHLKARGLDLLCDDYLKYMWDFLSPEAKKVIRAHYYGLISFQDRQVGRLLDFLSDAGIRENTVIVYTADHGEMLGDFGLYFKRNFYNGSVRIPLMISYPPQIEPFRESEALVGLQDLLPTLLALTGRPLQTEVDGTDLLAVIDGEAPEREYFVSQCNESPGQQYMVADKRWKYIYHEYGGVEELYDLQEDPDELENLAASGSAESVLASMRSRLIQWCEDNGDAQILADGELVRAERSERKRVTGDTRYTFGRRYY